jgi:hypothetical protein
VTVKATIAALTGPQRRVLDQVAVNNDGGHPLRVLNTLVSLGLITRHEERDRVKNGILDYCFTTVRYAVPIPVHMAWCELCAEECP